jgi:hypothetical protein
MVYICSGLLELANKKITVKNDQYIQGTPWFDLPTPGPRIMRIHLVQNSTSAKFEKNPKIFT